MYNVDNIAVCATQLTETCTYVALYTEFKNTNKQL